MNRLKIVLTGIAFLVAMPTITFAQSAFAEDPFLEPQIPGKVEGTGTHFEIKDSEYLNISLQSTEEITIDLESTPRMISMDISSSTDFTSTNLTISGLEPNKTYYKFQDSYKNKAVFIYNGNKEYDWVQDLTLSHHVWIQPETDKGIQSKDIQMQSGSDGVVFLPEECSDYGVWDQQTSTCALTQDLTESVEVTASNITLDCVGHSLTGAGTGTDFGVYVNRKTNVTVKNCAINNFHSGVYFYYGSNHSLNNNNVSNNRYYGIRLTRSNNITLTDNIVDSNPNWGISLYDSDNSSVINNTVSNNGIGIGLCLCKNNVLNNNTFDSNKGYGILFRYSQDSDIFENIISNNKCGFFLSSSNSNTITNNAFINDGLFTCHSFNTIMEGNTVNSKPLIYLENISDDIIKDIDAGQVILVNCDNITVENLNLFNTYIGIHLFKTNNSKIIGNNISEILFGIRLYDSDNNRILDNAVLNNQFGMYIHSSNNNTIFHNNFLHNSIQARSLYGAGNVFDNGYPSGGNYWSDYTGIDEKSGPNQDEPGSDNIGDTSYSFYHGIERRTDRYPFMEQSGWEESQIPTYKVAVILAEPNDVPHNASSTTAQPCKLISEKEYEGHNKEYYEDLTYCVTDYHRENSFGTVNLDFKIFDNNGDWFKLDKSEEYYFLKENKYKLVTDAETKAGIDPGLPEGEKIIIVVHSGVSEQFGQGKLGTHTWPGIHEIVVAENDPIDPWAHEIGHVLGVKLTPEKTSTPDIYKMGNMKNFGCLLGYNKYDLMAMSSPGRYKNPPNMSSYTKEFLQWLNYDIHPISDYGEYWINSLETSNLGDSVFRYNLSDDTNDESAEYYILEARNRNLKEWDSCLPKEKALVIYKVDTKGYEEYGYTTTAKGLKMTNEYRKINIPYFGGLLTPDGDSYLDMFDDIKISAISDELTDDTYKIRSKIEKNRL